MAIVRFLTTGSNTWTCPPGVTTVFVQCWGGGGGSGGAAGNPSATGGGGGGAYAHAEMSVTPGTVYNLNVGAGGTAGTAVGGGGGNGGDSWFNTAGLLNATGGTGSAGVTANSTYGTGGGGGSNATCIGTVVYSGGAGGNADATTSGAGGGGAGGFLDRLTADGGVGNAGVSGTQGAVKTQYGGIGGLSKPSTGGVGATPVVTTTHSSNFGGGAGAPFANSATDRAGAAGRQGAVIIHYDSGDAFLNFL